MAEGKDRPEDLLGRGVLALTIDQGQHMQRYQGVVELEGESLEEVVGHGLRVKQLTIATAESCTGGLIAAALTAIPGSSDVV